MLKKKFFVLINGLKAYKKISIEIEQKEDGRGADGPGETRGSRASGVVRWFFEGDGWESCLGSVRWVFRETRGSEEGGKLRSRASSPQQWWRQPGKHKGEDLQERPRSGAPLDCGGGKRGSTVGEEGSKVKAPNNEVVVWDEEKMPRGSSGE